MTTRLRLAIFALLLAAALGLGAAAGAIVGPLGTVDDPPSSHHLPRMPR